MLIVDNALKKRADAGNPIRVGLIGAGYSGKRIAYQINRATPGLRVVAIANRTIEHARTALMQCGCNDVSEAASGAELDAKVAQGRYVVTDDHRALTESESIDVVVEATGVVEAGAKGVLSAIENDKHAILMNVELDATVGPVLKRMAAAKGLVYSNSDGDEPGVAMNMIRLVKSLGLTPLVAGNLKGLYDRYRTPETQREFATRNGQKATTMTHFADGTKLSMELTVLANAAGFSVAQRGMYGPSLGHVNESAEFFKDKVLSGGMVDFLVGAAPSNGAFVLGHTDDPLRKEYLKYLKMGDGPLYVFYTPFHLPHLEIPNTVARAVLFEDAAVAPMDAPMCDSVAIAKRDLVAGEVLDGIGGFTAYALIDRYETSVAENLLPMGVAEGCRLLRPIAKDRAITYADVELPRGRLVDELRARQNREFGLQRAGA
jgi:predicted homoserine dehydrogenase-like protein